MLRPGVLGRGNFPFHACAAAVRLVGWVRVRVRVTAGVGRVRGPGGWGGRQVRAQDVRP